MAGATNTIIQILRSDVTAYPTSLNPGEQAYSHVSNKLFIGNSSGAVITIGGQYYVDLLDNATSSNTSNTIVRRDDSGNVTFKMVSVLDNPSQSGDVVNKGYLDSRINTLAANTIYEGTPGTDGFSNVIVRSTVDGGTVQITANNDLVAGFTKTLSYFYNDVAVTGNLLVQGNTSYTNVTTLLVSNNDIVLNANASGFPLINAYLTVNRGAADNAAIIWNEATDRWQVDRATGTNYDIVDTAGGQSIAGLTTLNSANVSFGLTAGTLLVGDTAIVNQFISNTAISSNTLFTNASANVGSLLIKGTKVLDTNFGLPVSFGGTGLQSVTANAVIYGNGTGAFGFTNSPTRGQVLQYRTDGVKFGGLDGGEF